MCGRPKASFICDPDFILERGNAEKLDQMAVEFQKSTSCLCPRCTDDMGISIGIFIKHNISQESALKYPSGKDLSEMLRRRWGLSTCESDIVLILLTQQNISDFSMGPAVKNIFPHETAAQIMHQCRVHFYSGWYYQGLESIVNSFNDVIVRLQRQYTTTYKNLIVGVALGFATLFLLAVAAIIIVHRQGQRKKKNCSDAYESVPQKNNRRRSSFDQEEHFEKLKRLNSSDDDDYEDGDASFGQYAFKPRETLSPVQFMRLNRQLSDVKEESSDDSEVLKRNSGRASSFGSAHFSPNRPIPVTEL